MSSKPPHDAQECERKRAAKDRSAFFGHWRRLSWAARLAAIPVYIYRLFLSPLLPRNCRFEPSCSVYALEALSRHGALKGGWLTLRRLARCHPFESLGAGSGYDPVPGTEEAQRLEAQRTEAQKKDAGDG